MSNGKDYIVVLEIRECLFFLIKENQPLKEPIAIIYIFRSTIFL